MNGKPKSYRAMLIAVAAANHPELDGTDKALLHVLAINADSETGKNSRPGSAALLAATCLKWSALHERVNGNVRRGLIECTYKANGKGKASVYRLCLDNPAYPDRSPSGEWLLDGPDPGPDSGLASVRPEPDSLDLQPSGLNRTDDSASVRPDSAIRPAQPAEPSGQAPHPSGVDPYPSGLDRTTSKGTSNIASKITTTNTHTSAKNKNAGVCVNEEPYSQVMKFIHDDMRASQWKKNEQEQLRNLIAQYGWETVIAVEHLYWQEQDPTFFGRTAFKWTALIAAFPGWLSKVTPEMLKDQAYRRWKATPEGKAECERRENECIQQQVKEHRKLYGFDDPRPYDWHAAIESCLAGETVPAPAEMYHDDMGFWPTVNIKHEKKNYELKRDEATGNLVCTASG